jgi:hypothetical protein
MPDQIPKWDDATQASAVDANKEKVMVDLTPGNKIRIIGIQTWWWSVSAYSPSMLEAPPKDTWLDFNKDKLLIITQHRAPPVVVPPVVPVVPPGVAAPYVPSTPPHPRSFVVTRILT